MISRVADIVGIAGFCISLITLLLALEIKSKIVKEFDRNQFSKNKDQMLTELVTFNETAISMQLSSEELINALRGIHGVLEQIKRYSIWEETDLAEIDKLTTETVVSMNTFSRKPLFGNHKNYDERYNSFKNSYCTKLNTVIAIMKKESSVL